MEYDDIKHQTPKITILYDNSGCNSHLKCGFGFSCYIEWKSCKILFDTGGDGEALFSNLNSLNIKLDQITHVLFSHHHWDHTAAIDQVLDSISDKATVYLPDRFSSKLERRIPKKVKTEKVKYFAQIDDGIYSLVLKGNYFLSTIHEQALFIKTEKGVVIITGCAHPGIVEIVEVAKLAFGDVYLVLGGFHLSHSFSCTSAGIVRKFKELGVQNVAPCHCAGDRAIGQFRDVYNSNFIKVEVGTVIDL